MLSMLSMAPSHRLRSGSSRRFAALTSMLLCCAALAQPLAPDSSSPPSAEEIEARIQALEADSGIAPDEQAAAIARYRRALKMLQTAEQHRERQRAMAELADNAERYVADMRQDIKGQDDIRIPPDLPYDELTQRLAAAQSELAAARADIKQLDQQMNELRRSPSELQSQLAEARTALNTTLNELTVGAPQTVAATVVTARRAAQRAEIAAREAEIAMLETALRTVGQRIALAAARRNVAEQSAKRAEQRMAAIEAQLSGQRKEFAERGKELASQMALAAQDLPAPVAAIAKDNAELARTMAALIEDIEQSSRRQQLLREQIEEVTELYRTARTQMEIARLGGTLGRVLHRQRQQLPKLNQYTNAARERNELIAQARLAQFELQEKLENAAAAEAASEALVADLPQEQRAEVRRQVQDLLNRQRSLWRQLEETYGAYITELGELDQLERELIEQAESYAQLLEKNLFWLPDTRPVGWGWIMGVGSGLWALGSPRQWLEVGTDLVGGFAAQPFLALVGALVVAALGYYAPRLMRYGSEQAAYIGRYDKDRFWITVEQLAITVIAALPWPIAIGLLSWVLSSPSAEQQPVTVAIAAGLWAAAQILLVLRIIQRACDDGGLLHRHFGWSEKTRTALIGPLKRLLALLLATTFLVATTNQLGEHSDTVGRAAFLLFSLALSLYIWRALHPERGALSGYFTPARQHGRLWQLRALWFTPIALLPAALGILAISGYYYTAMQLQGRLFATGALIGLAVIGLEMVIRWLNIAELRLAVQRNQPGRDDRPESEQQGEATVEIPESHTVDLSAADAQVRTLIRIALAFLIGGGLWWIWQETLPALGALNEIVLWEYVSGSGEAQSIGSVTAAGLGLAIIAALLTFFAARNLPGLLEMAVLQRLQVDHGTRYAANSISRYIIVFVGILMIVNMLGLEWGRLQWLIAALGVGLGFGLQEIVANFISGIIILFERPFRVGDTVTVGSVSGTVTRIQIRATTITDWDRKELIVPNKAFITDQLVNWTLSDPILRVTVPVGIAYGSDTELARRLLMETAQGNPRSLEEPPPQVWFLGFGDSSLNFEVRAFIRSLPDMLPITHELHVEIDRAFRAHGIEIAFPQRDLHIRSLPAGIAPPAAGATAAPKSQQ